MSQFVKQQTISLNPTQANSLQTALTKYRQCLVNGSAFNHYGLFDIAFIDEANNQPLTTADAGENQALLQQALQHCRQENRNSYNSEAVLFAAALNFTEADFPELTQELKLTAQAMVDYARCHNDSSNMFVDESNIFGLEALLMLALTDLENTHYLASFLIPYWDSESFSEGPELLNFLVGKFGWQRPLIKAYLYCDSFIMRRFFYCDREDEQVQTDLLSHLQQHPDDYQWFKDELSQRLLTRPVIAYPSESLNNQEVVAQFFYSLGSWQVEADYDDDEALWQDQVQEEQLFGNTVEAETLALLTALETEQPQLQLEIIADAWQEDDDSAGESEELEKFEQDEAQTDNKKPQQQHESKANFGEWDCFEKWTSALRYAVSPRDEKLNIKAYASFEKLNTALADSQEDWLSALPPHHGSCAFVCYRLKHHPCSEVEIQLLLQWLENELPSRFVEHMLDNADDDHEHFDKIVNWLSDANATDNIEHIISLSRSFFYTDGGTLGDSVSIKQPAYHLFWQYDGFQRGILSLFWLLSSNKLTAQSPLAVLVKRYWQLLNALAPQRVIGRIFYYESDYNSYPAINDVAQEYQLHEQLSALGVAEAQLQTFELMLDQRIAGYRPADPRFYQRYLTSIEQFATADANDTSMIGSHQWRQRQQLIEQLNYCHELQQLQFYADVQLTYPDCELPIIALFNQSLLHSLEAFLDNQQQALSVVEKLQAYLQSGENLAELSPSALKLPKLQGWDPYSDYRKTGPADFVWLLPEPQAIRLVQFFTQLGRRGLHWLSIPSVKTAYVHSLIRAGKLTLAERWTDPQVGHNTISDPDVGLPLLAAKDNWALNWMDEHGIETQALVYYAVHEGRDCEPFINKLATQQRLPDMAKMLTKAEQAKLKLMVAQAQAIQEVEPSKKSIATVEPEQSTRQEPLAIKEPLVTEAQTESQKEGIFRQFSAAIKSIFNLNFG